jgi:hypothetical protein
MTSKPNDGDENEIENDEKNDNDYGVMTQFKDALVERVTALPDFDPVSFWFRFSITAALLVWGVRLMKYDYRTGEINQSFMHGIILVFHEAGHVFFRLFGEFMMVAGGSLFQLMMPAIVAGAFLWTNRDPLAASLGVWWVGVSLMDLSPYIYDAKVPQLTLLNGKSGEAGGHDWIYLLGRFNAVDHSPMVGAIAHGIGAFLMWVGITGAA